VLDVVVLVVAVTDGHVAKLHNPRSQRNRQKIFSLVT